MNITLPGYPSELFNQLLSYPVTKEIRGVSHRGLAIYIKKKYLKAKEEELWKLSNISPCKNIIFKNIPLQETKILQDIIITLL
jgi:hypothetical protein